VSDQNALMVTGFHFYLSYAHFTMWFINVLYGAYRLQKVCVYVQKAWQNLRKVQISELLSVREADLENDTLAA